MANPVTYEQMLLNMLPLKIVGNKTYGVAIILPRKSVPGA